ncbi:MAG: RNA polymerase sigma factor, partial [Acidimicrobiia bacterium]|nr:RNA polymerase sigma factor [Acidimicrobiia bacterium]
WTHRTRRNRARVESIDDLHTEPEAPSIDPVRAGISVDVAPALSMALLGLSDSVRAVVVLKDVYGWSHQEIAEHLDISVTAAKVRLHRGRKALRARFSDYEDGLG